jgi:hypothetical protein
MQHQPAEDVHVRRTGFTFLFAVLAAAGAGAAWFVWLGRGCRNDLLGLGTLIVGGVLVIGAVVAVDRFRAWQTHSLRGSLAIDIVTLWLVLSCIVLATVGGSAHRCLG